MRRLARCVAVLACAATIAAGSPIAIADEVSVPINLQVDLLERVLRYERAFASEATPIGVLVVTRPSSTESTRVASQLTAELRRAGRLGGRAVGTTMAPYTTAAALRDDVGTSQARVVYLTAGLGRDVSAIATALSGTGVISVSAVGSDGDRGAVLCFELVSSRPRIVVNLRTARAQHLQFNAQFLRLARVVQ